MVLISDFLWSMIFKKPKLRLWLRAGLRWANVEACRALNHSAQRFLENKANTKWSYMDLIQIRGFGAVKIQRKCFHKIQTAPSTVNWGEGLLIIPNGIYYGKFEKITIWPNGCLNLIFYLVILTCSKKPVALKFEKLFFLNW